MSLTLFHLIALIPPLLLLEGFFSGSEIALFSADRLVLKAAAKNGSKSAARALALIARPERILSTTLLMTNLCIIGTSALVAIYMLSKGYRHADLIAVAVTSPLIVLLGELIPKTIYQRYADRVAPWVAGPIAALYWAFYPATRFLSSYTSRISKLVGPIEELLTGKRRTTREELQSMLSFNQRESEIKTTEKRMIKRIFEFKDTETKHALIPLVKIDAIEESATVRQALDSFQQHRHSRMPVYSERVDNIIGVLESGDLFSATDLSAPIRNYVSSAHYAPETQSLEDLMMEMRREDTAMSVIVDEYGGAVGIITFEDILEEIVGEINDEYDSESLPYKDMGGSTWLIQARMEISQVNERLGLDLPEGDYETMAGFLLQQFGRIPDVRDELFFNTKSGTIKFTIRQASERHIETALVERIEQEEPPPES